MSTQGLIGIVSKRKLKVAMYNGSDSYPEFTGKEVAHLIKELNKSSLTDEIIINTNSYSLSRKDRKFIEKEGKEKFYNALLARSNDFMAQNELKTGFDLLRYRVDNLPEPINYDLYNSILDPTEEEVEDMKYYNIVNYGYPTNDAIPKILLDNLQCPLVDSSEFVKERACEHAYIFNLDDNELEYYTHSEEKVHQTERFYDENNQESYYKMKLIDTFKFQNVLDPESVKENKEEDQEMYAYFK
jgi:hypothetical protein